MSAPLPAPHWLVHHGAEKSAIEAFAVRRGEIELIAEIYDALEADHMANADFIVDAVNSYEKHCKLILDLTAALEKCFAGNGSNGPITAKEARSLCLRARKETAAWIKPDGRRSHN
jgi:hypothetical protein